MYISYLKKILSDVLLSSAVFFMLSICANAAQIDSFSIENGSLKAAVSDADGARLFVRDQTGSVLSSAEVKNGLAVLETEISDGKIFLWNSSSLAPLSPVYTLKASKAYAYGASAPLPEFDDSAYEFDQSENVMIVKSIASGVISGVRGGKEVSYELADSVDISGLSAKIDDIVPGAVVLPAIAYSGKCAAIELLAFPGDKITEHYGIHASSDGSVGYSNIIGKYSAKNGTTVKISFPPDSTKFPYVFKSTQTKYYRVTSADGEPVVTQYNIASKDGFPPASEYNIYIYMRYNNETERVTEAVLYATPTNYDPGAGDGDYSDMFSL